MTESKAQTQPLIKPPATAKAPELATVRPLKLAPSIEPEPIVTAPIAPIKIVEKLPETPQVNNATPWMHELEPEFRRTLPDLKINVYVYAEQASERFVMIDMVKYTVGSRIKDSVMLKEIRSDSLVLEYNKRIFRIKRP
jgi:general secretion pathway protein B